MNAISVRLEKIENNKIKHQRKHDFREYTDKNRPKYINPSKSYLNTILIEPKSEEEISKVLEEAQKHRKKKIRSNTAMLFAGIITFGVEAQQIVNQLPIQEQNQLFNQVIQAIAKFLNTDIESAVIHRDETAIHCHFSLFNLTRDGKTLTTKLKPDVMSKIQDIAYEQVKKYGIGRGKKKYERIMDREYNIIHKSVKQLHYELPNEIKQKINELNAIKLKINNMNNLLNSLQNQIKEQENIKQSKEKEIRDIQAKINELKPVMNSLKNNQQKLLENIDRLRKEEEAYREKIKKMLETERELKTQIENLQKEYEKIFTEYQRLQNIIKQINDIQRENDELKQIVDEDEAYIRSTINYFYNADREIYQLLIRRYRWLEEYVDKDKVDKSKSVNPNINMNR